MLTRCLKQTILAQAKGPLTPLSKLRQQLAMLTRREDNEDACFKYLDKFVLMVTELVFLAKV